MIIHNVQIHNDNLCFLQSYTVHIMLGFKKRSAWSRKKKRKMSQARPENWEFSNTELRIDPRKA